MNKKQRNPNCLEYAIVIIMVFISTVGILFGKVILPYRNKETNNE